MSIKIGQSDFDFHDPDLVVMRVVGIVDEAAAAQGGDVIVAFAPGGRVFILSDMRAGAAGMSGSARKAFIEHMRGVTLVAVAIVGGSFQTRVIARLLNSAMRLLSRHSPEIEFFDAEPGARAWLAQRGCRGVGSSPH